MDEKDLKSIALIASINPPQNVTTFSLSFLSGSNGIRFSSRPVFLEFLQIADFFYSDSAGAILGIANANVNLIFSPHTFVLNDAVSVSLDPGSNVLASIQYLLTRNDYFLRFEIPILRIIQPEQRLSTLAVNVRPVLATGLNDYFQVSLRLFWREL
jgi:hypothetical protein